VLVGRLQGQGPQDSDLDQAPRPTLGLGQGVQALQQPQGSIGLGLGQQHPSQHEVITFPQVGHLVVFAQALLPRPAGGLLHPSQGQQQPRPFGLSRIGQGDHVGPRIGPAGLLHGLQGAVRVAHGLADPGQRHQRDIQLGQLDHLPAALHALGGVLVGLVQLVALVEHLGDPHMGLTGVVDREPVALGR
jgi:hypothetical protein